MGLLIAFAIALVAATVAVALVTGERLMKARKALFQLEMAAEERRRQSAEAADRRKKAEGHLAILRRIRQEKVETLQALGEELAALQDERRREVGVRAGLQRRSFDLETVAA